MSVNATKPEINFDDVMSLDIKVCIVLEAERIPKSKKLIKLIVGGIDGKFTTVTNLGADYEPEDFVNKSFPFILNLEVKKIMGVPAEAMILAGDPGERMEKMCLLDVSETMPVGTVIL